MDDFTDQEITCKDCHAPFVFSAGEQKFFAERQFSSPLRCKPCRDIRKAKKEAEGGGKDRR